MPCQICMTIQKTKEDILKKVGNRTVTTDFHSMENFLIIIFIFFIYVLLCSTEEVRSYRWVNK